MSDLSRAADELAVRLRRWNGKSWAVPVGAGTRADAVFAALQRLADLGADADGRPRRPVPRFPAEGTLADQLVVLARDVARADDATAVTTARNELSTLERTLGLR